MPRSVLTDGVNFTRGCKTCPFWSDGTNPLLGGYGCCIPAPIMECPYFREVYEAEEKQRKERTEQNEG